MPRAEHEPMNYLTKRGRKIFFDIARHVRDHELLHDIDTFELSMLANAFDLFEVNATICNQPDGVTAIMEGKNGAYKAISPEYTIMKQQYDLILKHSPKYGLTPGDREKIFGGMKKKKRVDPTADLD